MAESHDAWTMLKRAFSRNLRLSLYLAASTGCVMALSKLVSVHKVTGTSMLPYLQEGDWIFAESITTRFFPQKYPVKVGDVVILQSPVDLGVRVVKRVVALEDDIVPNKLKTPLANCYNYDDDSILVPGNSMWVEGDNKTTSKDSRHYGPVSRSLLAYRAVAKIRPEFKVLSDPYLVMLLNGDTRWSARNSPLLQAVGLKKD